MLRVLLVSGFILGVLSLSPEPISKAIDTVSENYGASCDSSCYLTWNSVQLSSRNITLLCGTDGLTYLNFDELNCVRQRCGLTVGLQYYGRCRRLPVMLPTQQLKQQQQQKYVVPIPLDKSLLRFLTQQPQLQPQQPLNFPDTKIRPNQWKVPNYKRICLPAECNCPDNVFQPVCGSDKVTYGNLCLLQCKRECQPGLVKLYDGYCGKGVYQRTNCISNQCGCPQVEYEDNGLNLQSPVCGSDGVTYGNRCLLECNKNCNADLEFMYTGYCKRLVYPESSENK